MDGIIQTMDPGYLVESRELCQDLWKQEIHHKVNYKVFDLYFDRELGRTNWNWNWNWIAR